MSNVQYQPQQYQNVQEVLDQQGLSNLPPNSVVYYQVNGGPPQSYNPNQQYYVQQESDEFVPQGFVRTTQVTQQAPKVPPHQNLQTSQTKYQQQDQQKQNVQQFQQRGQQQFQQNVQQQPQQGGQQQQYQQSQQVGQQQFQQRQQPQQAGQPQFQQTQQVGQQQFQQQRTQPQQQYQQAQQSQRQFQQPGQQQQQQNVQYDQYPQEFTDSRFQGYSENDYNDPYRYQHAIQRAERAQSEKRSYLVDADGNYQSVADAPTYTTKEPDGTPAVSYSAFPRRAKSVEPAAGAAEVGYLYGGSDFIDHTQDYFDINGELVDLTIHAPPKFIRRDGDNYGLDFNSSVHRGENVDVEEDYTGYHAQKPRKHWTYCEDPFNPDNTYVPDLFSYYDPNDLVGDTIANHRLLVEKQLTDEEREQFCTPFASTPGFLPQHRTEKPEPKEPGPICYSLSAKKELARDADYRPPSRSQSVGPVNAGYASGVQQKKDVNLLSLLDDSAIQRQANVIKPAPWAPESDYKQGRWQTSSQQLEPLNRRPQAEATQPEWSQQIQDKKSTFVGQQGGAQVQQPPYWQNQTAQPRGAWQEAAQRQGAQQPQQGQPGNVSTQYTYYQKGQQPQQVPQQQQQHPDANVAFTVQRGQGQQAQQVPQQQQRPGQQPVQRQPQQVQQQRPVAQQQQQTIQRRPQSQPPPQVQQRQQQPSQQYQQITTATTRTVVNGQPVQQQQSLGQPQGQQVKQVGFAQQQQPLNVANGNVGRQQPQQFRQGQQIQAQNVVNKQQPQQQVRQVPGKPVQQNGTIPAVAPKPGQQQFAQGQPQQQSQQVRYVQQPQGQTQQTFITSQGQYYTQGGQPQQGQVTNQQTIYKQVKVQR